MNSQYIAIEELPEIEFEVTSDIQQENKVFTNTRTDAPTKILHHLDQTAFHFYNTVKFKTEEFGVIAGGTSLRTRITKDGGKSWMEFQFSKFANAFHDIAFIEDALFVVGESNFIFRSIDDGEHWSVFNMEPLFEASPLTQFKCYKIKFINNLTGFIAGERNGMALLLKTTDAGKTWTTTENVGLMDKEFGIGDIHLISEKEIRMVALSGRCYKSEDQGKTWTLLFDTGDTNKSLNAIEFFDTNTGFVSGLNGALFLTQDGGNSWNQIILPPTLRKCNVSDLLSVNNRLYFTTATSFSDNLQESFVYTVDKDGTNISAFLTKKDSTIIFIDESFKIDTQGNKLYITTRNNVYSTDIPK